MPKRTQRIKKRRLTKAAGYVYYDTARKDENGFPIRNVDCLSVEVDLQGYDPDDCGPGTEIIMKALEAKVAARFKVDRNVECRECWEC